MRFQNILRNTFKQGVIMGLAFCFYTVFMGLSRLDTTYLNIGQYFDMAIIILPISMIFWAIRQENNIYKVTILQRIIIAVFVSAISFLIYDPFLYVYHHYINPEWFTSVLYLKETELNAATIPQDKIMDTLKKMKNSNIAQSKLFSLSALVPTVFILPTLIALFSVVFIKKK